MSQAPTPMETTNTYAPPAVTQFSVFLVNKVGRLHELVKAFDGQDCRICALAVHDATDHAVVRIVTNSAQLCRNKLRELNHSFSEKDILVVELSKSQTLTSLCASVLTAELSIHFAYPMMVEPGGNPTIALAVDDLTLAGQIPRRKEFRLFAEQELIRQPNQ